MHKNPESNIGRTESYDPSRCYICNTIIDVNFHDLEITIEDEPSSNLNKTYNICRGNCCNNMKVICILLLLSDILLAIKRLWHN